MELLKDKILIISFYFPPFERVGGRRWAKHAKSLFKAKADFFILAANIKNGNSNSWNKDISAFPERISRIDANIKYPFFKKTLPNNFFEKIYWKLSHMYWSFLEKKSTGNFWDDSEGYQQAFYKKAKQLIAEKQINTVIVSVGPYHYASIIPLLKKEFPQVKFIVDFRDYWEDGLAQLDQHKRKTELEMQASILSTADAIITVNNEMKLYYNKIADTKPVHVLAHCFDPDDIPQLVSHETAIPNSKTIKIIYGGALYGKMEEHIERFGVFLNKLRATGRSVECEFYTAQPAYENVLSKYGIEIKKQIPLKDYFEKLKESDFVLLFRPNWSPNAFSSKFFEIVAFRKPLLYFGPSSDVSALIESRQLGIHFDAQKLNTSFDSFLKAIDLGCLPDLTYDINQHTFEYQTRQLITFLNGLE